ncbi:MAG: hypothetical protein ACRETL_03175 [Gammaproteobacteria bacterium]
MTNDIHGISRDGPAGLAASPAQGGVDWRALAYQRLTRLVEIEHDHSIMRDRLAQLQVDYREILVASDGQLQRLTEMDRMRMKLEDRFAGLAREYADMQASFVGSRSWRLTRPLRTISAWRGKGRHGVGRLARTLLRVPLLRRAARLVVRLVPGLHERLRFRLYPPAGQEDQRNFP